MKLSVSEPAGRKIIQARAWAVELNSSMIDICTYIAHAGVMEETIAGFEWDEGNWPKCGKHGVSKDAIEHVLSSGPLVLADR
jgi:hypothetical protein